jgi:DNA modification methylase
MQDDGWILRQAIVWDKIWNRPESVTDRATQTYEMIFMLVKKPGYFYDQDPLRVPSVSSHTTRSKPKAGAIRHDIARTNLRALNNPIGHNAPSVWQISHSGYVGSHPAAFPTELVRRIIVTACDTDSLVLDPFGGSGTTALVALQHGHRAITIDSHRPFTDEARERLSNAPAHYREATDITNEMELAADCNSMPSRHNKGGRCADSGGQPHGEQTTVIPDEQHFGIDADNRGDCQRTLRFVGMAEVRSLITRR